MKKIRLDFVQSYRYYKTAMDQGDSSQGGIRTASYCYPFSIEGILLSEIDADDLERMRNRRHEPVFKNQLWRYLAAKFGNTEYKLSIRSGKLDSITEAVRDRLRKHLGKECTGFNQAITRLQETLQGYLQNHNLHADLQLPSIKSEALMGASRQPISIGSDEILVKYGYGQSFREAKTWIGSILYLRGCTKINLLIFN